MNKRRHRPSHHHGGQGGTPGSAGGMQGSPEPEYLTVGRIVRPHGIRGDVAMKLLTEYPERLSGVDAVYVGPDYQPMYLERARQHQTGLLIKFKGVSDRDAAEELRNQFVYVHIDDAIPLEEGEVYLYQIEGMQVVTEDGEALGRITNYIETGANDVYVVTTPEEDEILLPAIPQVIVGIDVENRVMTVHLLDGLID